jgi:hypothetical protein
MIFLDLGQYLYSLKNSSKALISLLDSQYSDGTSERKIAFIYVATYMLLQARNRSNSLELIEPLCYALQKWIEIYAK